tara:strand:- start:220 stop:567 length:348 start_codon:yes stop_codon:yes gene_type:complete
MFFYLLLLGYTTNNIDDYKYYDTNFLEKEKWNNQFYGKDTELDFHYIAFFDKTYSYNDLLEANSKYEQLKQTDIPSPQKSIPELVPKKYIQKLIPSPSPAPSTRLLPDTPATPIL